MSSEVARTEEILVLYRPQSGITREPRAGCPFPPQPASSGNSSGRGERAASLRRRGNFPSYLRFYRAPESKGFLSEKPEPFLQLGG